EAAVAHAARVLHDDLEIATQTEVLQAVVADHHVYLGVLAAQPAQGGGAIRMDRDRNAGLCGDQRRLVAKERSLECSGAHPWLVCRLAAVAPADDAGVPAARLQCLDQGNGDRGLARAAHIDVADHHDGSGFVVDAPGALELCLAPCEGGRMRPGQRPQLGAHQPFFLTGSVQGAFEAFLHGLACVAKCTRSIPACRAASMTRTTAAWAAWASASITSTSIAGSALAAST